MIRARHPDAGAYLLKDRVANPDRLVDALREVVAGRSVVDAEVVAALVADRTRRARSPLAQLTPCELDVLREMAEGKTNLAISRSLFLSESAVEKVRELGLLETMPH
jgi:DNA-binding NarL/FixJ family response regulator